MGVGSDLLCRLLFSALSLVALLSQVAAAETVFRGDLAGHVTGHMHTGFPTDTLGTELDQVRTLGSRTRVRLEAGTEELFAPVRLRIRLGGDAGAGTWLGRPTLAGDALPESEHTAWSLNEAYVHLELGPWFGARGGLMLSQWGLGLVANAGDDLFNGRMQERLFESARTGDRLLRAAIFAKPFASLGDSSLRGLVLAGAFDEVQSDDTSDTRAGDETYQGVASVRLFVAPTEWVGLYYVYRHQTTADGKTVQAHVVDFAGDLRFGLGSGHTLRLQAEMAAIFGETDLAPSPEHPTHDILQLGGLARVQWRTTSWPLWAEFDLGYFSGDSNLDDDRITRFVADRNLQQGFILFPTILGWHTGRQRISADRPEVLGYPPEDMDRLATNGGVTSAVTIYPKGVWTPTPWLDLYGGLLFAFSTEPIPDPYTSRTQEGGAARNALGLAPTSSYLGTEADLGARVRFAIPGADLGFVASTEYGVLIPGGGLEGMAPVHAVRLLFSVATSVSVESEEGPK